MIRKRDLIYLRIWMLYLRVRAGVLQRPLIRRKWTEKSMEEELLMIRDLLLPHFLHFVR